MRPYYQDDQLTLWHGDTLSVLGRLADESVDCCVTSPPYFGLRDYGSEPVAWPEVSYSPMAGLEPLVIPACRVSLGHEDSPAAFVGHLVAVFREVRRTLAEHGTLWLNIGDAYAGKANQGKAFTKNRGNNLKPVGYPPQRNMTAHAPYKSLLGIPWRASLALQADGWILRNENIWAKPTPMPEPVRDRCTSAHEHVFMFAKSSSYYFDSEAIAEPATGGASGNSFRRDEQISRGGPGSEQRWDGSETKNRRDVWTIAPEPFPEAHFATYPSALPELCLRAGTRVGGTVLDPFSGSGTTGMAAARNGRKYVGIDLNAGYLDLSLRTRLAQPALMGEVGA